MLLTTVDLCHTTVTMLRVQAEEYTHTRALTVFLALTRARTRTREDWIIIRCTNDENFTGQLSNCARARVNECSTDRECSIVRRVRVLVLKCSS